MSNEDIEQQIDECCDQYEAEFRRGGSPDVLACLSRFDSEHQARLLCELLSLEIELRGPEQMEGKDDYYCEKLPRFADLIRECFSDGPPNDFETLVQSPEKVGVAARSPSPNRRIGNYKLLQTIGEGGMGVVWMADQESPVKRRVALKLIKKGLDNKQIIARFEAERQALAMMDHPNIARVLDAGTTEDGAPYFVMELVRGIPFTKYCDQHKLSIDERLRLFIPVCHAVQHAHQKGIIHRDLKPNNVLISLYDGKPVPKVIDFGLAKALEQQTKLTDKTMFTEFGQVVGTIQYMSPEQAEMNQLDIDTRTDIYSLGVMLYELLSGSTPIETETIRHKAILQVLATIREQEPPRPSARLSSSTDDAASGISAQRQIEPSRLKLILKGELDWIVMKSIEKDRTRRYDTAISLAADIGNYLQGDVVIARPPSLGYLASKYVRRHKGLVASLSSIAILLIAGIIGVGWFAIAANQARTRADNKTVEALDEKQRAENERQRAEVAARRAREAEQSAESALEKTEATLARSNYFLSLARWNEERAGEARDLLQQIPTQHRNFEWYLDYRTFQGSDVTLYGHEGRVSSVAFSPDGTRIVSGSWSGTRKLWDATTGQELGLFPENRFNGECIAFSHDGTRMVSQSNNSLLLRDVATGEDLQTFAGHSSRVHCVAFSPDATQIISGSQDGALTLWDATTGQKLRTLTGHASSVENVLFSPDGTRVVSTEFNATTTKLWETATGQELTTLPLPACVAFSPDGTRMIIGENLGGKLKLLDGATGQQIWEIDSHSTGVDCVAFSPDGTQVVSADHDDFGGSLALWDAATGRALRPSTFCHISPIETVAFTPDGTRIASGSHDETIRLWDVETGRPVTKLIGHSACVRNLAFSPDATRIASVSDDGTVKLWDGTVNWDITDERNVQTLVGHAGRVESVAFSPDGTRIVSGGGYRDHTLKIWDAMTGRDLQTIAAHSYIVSSVAFSPDGTQIVSGSGDSTLKLWDPVTGQELRTLAGHSDSVSSVAFSPDGTRIVSGSTDKTLKLWEAVTGRELRTLAGHSGSVMSVAFSPDGTRIVSGDGGIGSNDNQAKIWDAVTGQELRTLTGHSGQIRSVAFSPDGLRIISGSDDKTLKLWDAATGEELRTLDGHLKRVQSVAFSPDGTRIVSASADTSLKLWDAATGQELRTLIGHTDSVLSVAFSRDGMRIVSGHADKTLKLWNAETGQEVCLLAGHTSPLHVIASSSDGTRIVFGSQGETLTIWDAAMGKNLRTLAQPDCKIESVFFSPGQTMIVLLSEDRMMTLFDAQSGRELCRLSGYHSGEESYSQEQSVLFSPDETRIILRREDRTLTLCDAGSGQKLCRLTHDPSVGSQVFFSADGARIILVSEDKTLTICDSLTGKELQKLSGHSDFLLDVAFCPDGTQIVSSSDDKVMKLWDTQTGQELWTVSGLSDSVLHADFSPDGRRIATRGEGKHLTLWETATGRELWKLTGHSDLVTDSAFSPDGRRIISGSADNTLKLWDTSTGQELWTLAGHSDGIACVAFSPDGTRNVSRSWDGTVKLWDSEAGQELRTLTGDPADFERRVAFSPDSTQVVLRNASGTSIQPLWNIDAGQIVKEEQRRGTSDLRQRSPKSRWQPVQLDEKIGLVDLDFKDLPLENARRARAAAPKPLWHRQQVKIADKNSDRYAATFHLAWLLIVHAESDEEDAKVLSSYRQLRDRYTSLNDTQKSTLRQLVQQAILAAKPAVDRYREQFAVPEGHDDLLGILDLKTAWKRGDWKLIEGVPTGSVVLEGLVKDAVIEFPYTPPDEYQMTAMVEPLDKPSSLLLRQRMGGHPFLVTLAYANQNSLELIDGKPIPNETTDVRPLFQQNEISEVVVTVKKDSVQVVVDGQTIIDWTGDPPRLSLSHSTPDQDVLAIHTMFCRYRIHRLSIEPISGKGTELKPKN